MLRFVNCYIRIYIHTYIHQNRGILTVFHPMGDNIYVYIYRNLAWKSMLRFYCDVPNFTRIGERGMGMTTLPVWKRLGDAYDF